MGRATAIFLPLPLGRGQKVKYHLISITKSISKIFIQNFVFVLINERDGISFCSRGGTLGRWGCPGGQLCFFKHGHVAYQIDEDDQLNRIQVSCSS